MNIKEYLKLHNLRVYKMAEDLGITKEYLSKLIHGRYKPSKQLKTLITYYTENEVTLADLEEIKNAN